MSLKSVWSLTAKGHRTKATLKFIAFGAEETGLDGSFYYVSENFDEVSTMGLGMINLDMIAVGDTLQIGNIGYPDGGGPQLMNYTQQKATAMGMAWESFTAGANSDHTYFEQGGRPGCLYHPEARPLLSHRRGYPRQDPSRHTGGER